MTLSCGCSPTASRTASRSSSVRRAARSFPPARRSTSAPAAPVVAWTRTLVAVDPRGSHQHDCPPLGLHDPVVLIPVVVRAARRGEHLAAQQPQSVGIDPGRRVVRADDAGPSFDRGPLPARPESDGDLRPRRAGCRAWPCRRSRIPRRRGRTPGRGARPHSQARTGWSRRRGPWRSRRGSYPDCRSRQLLTTSPCPILAHEPGCARRLPG